MGRKKKSGLESLEGKKIHFFKPSTISVVWFENNFLSWFNLALFFPLIFFILLHGNLFIIKQDLAPVFQRVNLVIHT